MNTRVPEHAQPSSGGRGPAPARWRSDPRLHAAAWAVVVAVALFASGPETGDLAPWLRRFEALGGDKLVHGVLFGVQAWLLVRALRPGERGVIRSALLALVLSAVYGALGEVVQAVLPSRSADVYDLAADVAGALVGAGTAAYLARRR